MSVEEGKDGYTLKYNGRKKEKENNKEMQGIKLFVRRRKNYPLLLYAKYTVI